MAKCDFRPSAGEECPLRKWLGKDGKYGRDRNPKYEDNFAKEEVNGIYELLTDKNSKCNI
ncbi:hypothetical protein TetV_629 [Tetraselmis virus 1]|uniref:Uncharacterized protein n=1 Tax=Tetraselmis virus 1 TaxID=2060617 RepID=A0A2P0VP96_9VIRU|nr:hypothetical protein QJ968_gp425 [Tetraselmis virus 1]AUF82711.1 hypothetical protein TetV_629 [Tetraselmis virus 1]